MAFTVVRYVAAIMSYTSIFVIISNVVSSRDMGKANGMGQSAASLARGVGPALASVAFAWSLTNGLPFPLNSYFIYLVIVTLAVTTLAISATLPKSVNRSVNR